MVAGAKHYEPGVKSSGQRSKRAEAARTQKNTGAREEAVVKGQKRNSRGPRAEQQEQQNTGTKNK